ncbi:MAG: hypothetical protein AABW63_01715 [Nanoarchaeota archaeon]
MKNSLNKEGQTGLPLNSKDLTRKYLKGFGFFLFLVGVFFIITSFFRVPITGFSVSDQSRGGISFIGIVLEILGIVLMVIKRKSD